MSTNIIITVAPTGGWGHGKGNPITPDHISREVIACADAGAAIAHLHARDYEGVLTADLSCFSAAVEGIRSQSDILIEASTGGLSGLSAAERALPASHREASMGSLNIGSLNFGDDVYMNGVPDVKLWIELMEQYGAKPSLEIFDSGHLETARYLIDQALVATPANFNFIFDVKWGMPFDASLLEYLIGRLPDDSIWGATFVGSADFSSHVIASQSGARFVRCGFEDSILYSGKTASCNADLVFALRKEIEGAGFAVADPETAREILLT